MADTVIVGVSGAPVSARAVDWAAARAAQAHQKLELFGIIGGALGTVGEEEVVQDARTRTQALLDSEAARIADTGVDVSTRVAAGNPVSHLIDASGDASLLVIGSDYRGPGTGPARGAHGIRIAAGAKCPVVVVPDIDLGEREGVVVGVDGSKTSDAAVRFAAAEAARLGEPLVAVSVWTPLQAPRNGLAVYPDLYLANMQSATEEIQNLALSEIVSAHPELEIVRVVERGYPSHVINERAATARMTVVGTHGRGALARFLLGSISQEVLARLATVTAVVR